MKEKRRISSGKALENITVSVHDFGAADRQERYTNDNYVFISVGAAKHKPPKPMARPSLFPTASTQIKKTQSSLKESGVNGKTTYMSSNPKIVKIHSNGKMTSVSVA